jgi:hypothetical protein
MFFSKNSWHSRMDLELQAHQLGSPVIIVQVRSHSPDWAQRCGLMASNLIPSIDLGYVFPRVRIGFFRDREGNILELMEGYRDEER